jgi:hypothetical protein
MNKMTFLCQGLAQFRGQYAASAKCGITNNANSHAIDLTPEDNSFEAAWVCRLTQKFSGLRSMP